MSKKKDSMQEIMEMGDNSVATIPDEKQWLGVTGFSRKNNEAVANRIISDVEQGSISALDAHVLSKSLENTAKLIIEGIKPLALKEAEAQGAKSFQWKGCKVEIKETGVKYDYSATNDTVWADLNSQIEELTTKRKEREAFLRTVRGAMTVASEDTEGEMISIKEAVKTSTTSIVVTIS